MAERLEPGLVGELEVEVDGSMTAEHLGSGDVQVLATPRMVQLAERASMAAVKGRLPEGQTTVGTRIELDHLAPTPVGQLVTATSRLERVEGRRLTFSFEIRDPGGVVGRGIHVRAMVDRGRFLQVARERSG